MRRGLGDSTFEVEDKAGDREVTLGPMTLAWIGLALVALCAACFVSGYAIGHRAPSELANGSGAKEPPSAAQLFNSQPKPSAVQNPESNAGESPAPEKANSAAGTVESTSDSAGMQTSATAADLAITGRPAVLPAAMPTQSNNAANSQPTVRAALPQGGPGSSLWMVQIAATANAKDAGLMMTDLRGKGVNATLRRDEKENVIYVQAGPFGSHEEAAGVRQKVIAAGYNAIIQP